MLSKETKERIVAFAAALTIVVCAVLAGYSQAPSPQVAQEEQPETQPTTEQGSNTERGTPNVPLVVETHEGTPSPEIAAQKAEDREAHANSEWWIAKGTVVLAAFTVVLVLATLLLGYRAWRQEQHFKSSERAYLELGHTRPGITFDENGSPTVELKIRNVGRTPCHVENSVVGFAVVPCSKDGRFPMPSYEVFAHPHPNQGYLVHKGYMYVRPHFPNGTEWPMAEVNRGTLILVACGYVEYTDAFGETRHAGWGRYYEPGNEGSPAGNLSYISDKQYNYDRPAKRRS